MGETHESLPRSLSALGADLLRRAGEAGSGRATEAIHAKPGGVLSQVVLALVEGRSLSEHDNPGEAFLQVLQGRVRLSAGEEQWELDTGDLITIPQHRHGLLALDDSVVVLTIARR